MDNQTSADLRAKALSAAILLALFAVPAPLLPPFRLAEFVHATTGIGVKLAYLATSMGLQFGFYLGLGGMAALAWKPSTRRGAHVVHGLAVAVGLVGIATVIRSLKLGYLPLLENAIVPISGCVMGVALAAVLRFRAWKAALAGAVGVVGLTLWGFVSTSLAAETEARLGQLVKDAPSLPSGEARFGAVMQSVFASARGDSDAGTAIDRNRAAILAAGIALGHERLARLAGLDRKSELIMAAARVRGGTSLRGREDWARHYALSAALAVIGNPFVSDAGGLIKEELDALAKGSGFSFGDLAADRAGVRFATAATDSEASAKLMQDRVGRGFAVDDFFPVMTGLSENLTVEEFRAVYGGVGTQRYRDTVQEIERRLDLCAGISTTPRNF